MEDKIKKAKQYATLAHARINQLRKYTLKPYHVHLKNVATLVASVTQSGSMIAAAWLHDIVEDTPVTFEDLEREFGPDIVALVRELTDISKPSDGNRATRKQIDRHHLAKATARAKTIKLADIIDNCEDICRHDPKFGRIYLTEIQALLPVLANGEAKLLTKAQHKAEECSVLLGITPSLKNDCVSEAANVHAISTPKHHGIRLFTKAFTARDIQEPLLSFDAQSIEKVLTNGLVQDVQILGVREQGRISRYLTQDDISSGKKIVTREFDQRQIVDIEAPLADIIHILTHFSACFTSVDQTIIGVIRRGDIEKPVVRMWLFGVIIMIEMLAGDLIRAQYPDGRWTDLISSGRREKAEVLLEERLRRGYQCNLLDCLQFSDKLQIVLRNQQFLEGAGFQSASNAKKALKDLESLRNNLAHGQEITRHDWPPIIRLAQRVQQLYGT
jgi:hypothetical protein